MTGRSATIGLELSGLTLAERILSVKIGRRAVPGELLVVEVDRVMVVDSIAPNVLRLLDEELGGRVVDPSRLSFVLDHVAPAATVAVATAQRDIRDFARRHGAGLFDVGRGICHQLLIEEGLAQPGTVVLGSDSHSTTYGAVCAFGSGVGATDIALAIATGNCWLRVPETIRVRFSGVRPPGTSAKDVALEVIRRLGADGATYCSLEFHGAESFSAGEKMTLANLAVEAGAKVGLVAPDRALARHYRVPAWLQVDPAADYQRTLDIDLSNIGPLLALPAQVDNVEPAARHLGTRIDQVFIGTCTNGRLEDLHAAAAELRGRRVAESTRLLIVPASATVFAEAVADGTAAVLLAAGAVFGTPGCGPCMGRHQGVLAPGEVCLSTGNRNFVGRMGSPDARILLGSPALAAASAAAGEIALPRSGA